MKKTLLCLLITSIIVFSLILNCSKGAEEIKIGAILPLTGDAAVYGEKVKNGIELALKEIQSSLKLNLRIVFEDSRLEPASGVNALQKLIRINKVPIVIGPISSGVVLSIAPIANSNQVVILSPYASNYRISEAGKYIFRIYPSDAIQGLIDAQLAIQLNLMKAAVFYINSDYGYGLKEVFEKNYKDLGGKVVLSEGFNTGETDFRIILNKIQSSKADFIFLPANEKEMEIILLQKREMGINIPIISTDSFLPEPIIRNVGIAAEGVIFTTFYQYDSIISKKFEENFEKIYSEKPSLLEALGYDSIWVIAKVVEMLIIERKPIISQMIIEKFNTLHYNGVTGDIAFDPKGDLVEQEKRFTIKIIKDLNVLDFNPDTIINTKEKDDY